MLYNRDVVLPIDNLLKPRRKYQDEELHQIAFQEQHKMFTLVRLYLKQAKKRQAKYADKGAKQVEFQINDPVYYKNNQRKGKLDYKWKPFYRIIERKGPTTYVIKNQLDGSTCKVHAEMLRAILMNGIYQQPMMEDQCEKQLMLFHQSNLQMNTIVILNKRVRMRSLPRSIRKKDSDDEDNIPFNGIV